MGSTIVDNMRWVRSIERLRALLPPLKMVTEQLGDLHDADPDLTPELTTILNSVVDAQQAIMRAATFLDARLDVKEGS